MLQGNDDDNGDEDTYNDGLDTDNDDNGLDTGNDDNDGDTDNDDNDGDIDLTGKGLARPRLPGIVLALLKAASFARW